MSGHLRHALIALLCTTFPLFAVTIDGTVTLRGETDHSGTRVLFTEASPSAVTDSAFTDESGFFSLDLAIGVYDIEYSHAGFVGFQIETVGFTVDETLDSVELLASATTLYGELSGTITQGEYYVIDDISVSQGSTLTIEAGTTILFDGYYRFTVNGTLIAEGTEEDSILFTRTEPTSETSWQGIWFEGCEDGCLLEYCIVEYSSFSGIKCLDRSSPEILKSTIRNNDTYGGGGGLDCYDYSAPYIADCVFTQNTAVQCGGIFIRASAAATDTTRIINCIISDNHAESAAGGIHCGEDHISQGGILIVENCVIHNNTSENWGAGGLSVIGDHVEIIGCAITDNTSDPSSPYGGIHCMEGSPKLINCTITGNSSDAITTDGSSVQINSCIIAFNTGYGVNFSNSPNAEILFCNFWENSSGSVGTPEQAPVLLGQIVTVNQNGDSSDVYYNISQDPMFVNQLEGNFHLQEISHCIDAGDTTLTDPDGTVTDIGAYYYPQPTGIDPVLTIPVTHKLLSNYPNPFNPSTNIEFVVDQSGLVNLAVYDILGRQVAELVNESMQSGVYSVSWNAQNTVGASLPSGSYWVMLNTPSQKAMHRIVLIR